MIRPLLSIWNFPSVSPPMIYVFDQKGNMVDEETEGDAGLPRRVLDKVAGLVGP